MEISFCRRYLSPESSINILNIIRYYKIPFNNKQWDNVKQKGLRNPELINRLKKRNKGLSQVVTTLILLVVGVLLASVVSYYATNVTMTRTSQEEVRITKAHVWVNFTGSVAAFKVQNLGGRDILIDQFLVRSIEADPPSVYYYRVPSGTMFNDDLNITSYDTLTGNEVLIDGRNYTRATTDLPLISGGEILVYIKGPDNIQMDDIGTTCNLGVTTNNAQYLTETNVRSATSQ